MVKVQDPQYNMIGVQGDPHYNMIGIQDNSNISVPKDLYCN